jgi:hypothetical protein
MMRSCVRCGHRQSLHGGFGRRGLRHPCSVRFCLCNGFVGGVES